MNPTIAQAEIDRAMERDPADAMAEYLAEFRSDLQSFVSIEIVRACTDRVRERLPQRDRSYVAFVDPSGGSSDSMTLAIAHAEGKTAVLDAVREVARRLVLALSSRSFRNCCIATKFGPCTAIVTRGNGRENNSSNAVSTTSHPSW